MVSAVQRFKSFLTALLLPALFILVPLIAAPPAAAQEVPYFVTYSHYLEEPGDLELEFKGVTGGPNGANRFYGGNLEFEYGATAWWTTEFYLDGQATENDSTIFTGFKWENRFRPLMREHWINPGLYAEYENLSADKSIREVVGHDGAPDFADSNAVARPQIERELELKLILSSNVKGWNVSENFISTKNFEESGPWEFGYAVAFSRPLKLKASPRKCTFCGEKFAVGAEMYGGLGDTDDLGFENTSHYVGPLINWRSPGGTVFSFSPQFGVNDYSIPRLYRFGVLHELPPLSRLFHRSKGGAQ